MFKIGDRVEIPGDCADNYIREHKYGLVISGGITPHVIPEGITDKNDYCYGHAYKLVKERKPMARRTFRLLKDTDVLKKGALVQEMCDDGDQDYELISDSDKFEILQSAQAGLVRSRPSVENNPKWFVEVFQVLPEYATKEEIKVYKKKGKK